MAVRAPKVAREEFAAAAWRLGEAGGYDAVKIRSIADDVGVSGALIYTYFADKATLMDELRRLGLSVLERALADVGHGDTALALCTAYVHYMREHAWLYVGESKQELHGAASPHAAALIGRLVVALVGAGRDAAKARELAMHVWLALRGVVTTTLGTMPGLPDDFVDAHVRMVVRGLLRGDACT